MQSDVMQKREAGYPFLTSPWSGRGISLPSQAPSTIDDAPWRTRHSNRPYRAIAISLLPLPRQAS